MKWSYRIVTVSGIEVRVHATFLMLLAFFGYVYFTEGGWNAAWQGITFVLLLFLCVLLHEFGHAFAARAYGIRTPDITLLPIGGLARLERMPSTPWQELVIAVAGPAVNVVIALLLFLAMGGRVPSQAELMEGSGNALFAGLLSINLLLVIFNLIPAFPMDGGRVLRAILAMSLPHARATEIAGRVGQVFAVLFGLYGVLGSVFGWPYASPMLVLIAAFIFMGARQEVAYANLRAAARNLRVGDAMQFHFKTAPANLRVGEVPPLLIHSNQNIFALVDDTMHLHGLASRDELASAVRSLPAEALVSSVARKLPVIHPDTLFNEAIELMQRVSEPVLPVVNGAGQIVGLLDLHYLQALSQAQGGEARRG